MNAPVRLKLTIRKLLTKTYIVLLAISTYTLVLVRDLRSILLWRFSYSLKARLSQVKQCYVVHMYIIHKHHYHPHPFTDADRGSDSNTRKKNHMEIQASPHMSNYT